MWIRQNGTKESEESIKKRRNLFNFSRSASTKMLEVLTVSRIRVHPY